MKAVEIQYKNFGKCICLSNEIIEVVVTADVGPRVIAYNLIGGENVFFNDEERKISVSNDDTDRFFGKGSKWYIYGGHRLWVSPEDYSTYYPDGTPVKYELTGNGAVFSSDVPNMTGFSHSMEIILMGGADVKVIHRVGNISCKDMTFAPWALSVMAPGGLEIVPQPDAPTGLLGNRVLALWPYSDMSDDRVYWGKDYITVRQDSGAATPFKFGINLEPGWACYINKGVVFIKKYNHNKNAVYPDFGVSFETYTNAEFIECETLGELKTYKPDETAVHEELWTLKPVNNVPDGKNPEKINEFVKGFVL